MALKLANITEWFNAIRISRQQKAFSTIKEEHKARLIEAGFGETFANEEAIFLSLASLERTLIPVLGDGYRTVDQLRGQLRRRMLPTGTTVGEWAKYDEFCGIEPAGDEDGVTEDVAEGEARKSTPPSFTRDDALWALENIPDGEVLEGDAPTAMAWSLLRQARADIKGQFAQKLLGIVAPKTDKADDAAADRQAFEACEGERQVAEAAVALVRQVKRRLDEGATEDEIAGELFPVLRSRPA